MRHDIKYIFRTSSCTRLAHCDFGGQGPNKWGCTDALVHFAVCDYTRFYARTGFHFSSFQMPLVHYNIPSPTGTYHTFRLDRLMRIETKVLHWLAIESMAHGLRLGPRHEADGLLSKVRAWWWTLLPFGKWSGEKMTTGFIPEPMSLRASWILVVTTDFTVQLCMHRWKRRLRMY